LKLLNDIFTGKDNLTYDAARVVGVLGAFAYIVFWCVQVAIARQFTPTDADAYGRGLAVVLLAMAGACTIKRSTEPEPGAAWAKERNELGSDRDIRIGSGDVRRN
jgi:hypothetical protein